MKFKNWIAMMLALCMFLGLCPLTASAASIVAEGACGEGGQMRWTLDSNGVLTITGQGAMDDWAYSGPDYALEPWYYHADDILSVVIGEGVTRIGDYAFSGCHNMNSVTFPSTLTSIGNGAFYDCDGFTEFTIPDTVRELGKSVLGHCSYLKQVKLPKGITVIPEGMFKNCVALEQFEVPATVTEMVGSTFASCKKLKTVTLPEGVTSIPVSCFEYCESLTTVNIPGSVKAVEDYAFRGCIALKSLTLPEGVEEIGSEIISNCKNLTSITVPASVTSMRNSFSRAYDLKTVKFLGHAPLMASNLFSGITVTANYPNNFPSWTADLLQNYGGTVKWVGYKSSADPGDTLARGKLGDNLTWTLKTDGTLVISGSGSMGSCRTGNPWKNYKSRIHAVVIEKGVTDIGEYAFDECTNLERVTIADSVVTIGHSSFFRCHALEEVNIPNGVEVIYAYAFAECTGLKKVTMADSVKRIEREAFQKCTNLSDVKLSGNLEFLDRGVFYQCTSLTTINLPNTLTEITLELFYGSGLTKIEIPENVYVIRFSAFSDSALQTLTLSAGVRQIEELAFSNCTQLKTVYFESLKAPAIGGNAFENVTATVYYPGEDASWDTAVAGDYGGNLTWVSTHTHTYTASVVAPTCTEQGYTLHTCKCGDSFKDTYVSALGHDYAVSSVIAPTCTEQGYTTYTCSRCGHSYNDNYVDALGHEYGKPVYLGREEGHRYTCSRCGDVKTESCSFDEVTVVKEATLHNSGIKKHTCTTCGGSYEAAYQYRISGSGRVETGIEVANQLKAVLGVEKFGAIIIANGDNFADALAGSYLASVKGAPILLHRNSGKGDELNEAYIAENLASGGTIYLLGGNVAIPDAIEENFLAQGYKVVRLYGNSRFSTNLKILEEAGVQGKEILICTGWEYADSLSASATGLPILMVNINTNALTDEQIAFLEANAGNKFTIIGGNKAVSEKLEADIEAIVGDVDRIYGDSREATSVAVAQRYVKNPATVLIAYSRNFPDGLCGGPLAYAMKAPLLLINSKKEADAAAYVSANGIARGIVLGGTAAVTEASVTAIFGE